MDIEKIIDIYCNEHTETKKSNIRHWFSKIEKMSRDIPLEESLRSKDFLLRCFSTSKISTLSRAQYQKIKEILLYLLDYLGIDKDIIPSRDEVIESSNMRGFFTDLGSALSFVDQVGNQTISGYNSIVGLVRIKSIVILTWLGFTPEEITNLTRDDIKFDGVSYIQKNDKKVELSNELFRILSLQAESSGVMTFPRGRIYAYKVESEYLIRNRSGEGMTPDNLHQLFKHFNELANGSKLLSFKGIKISSLFKHIYEDNTEEPLYLKIQKHAQCDKVVAYGYKRLYLQWIKKLHNK